MNTIPAFSWLAFLESVESDGPVVGEGNYSLASHQVGRNLDVGMHNPSTDRQGKPFLTDSCTTVNGHTMTCARQGTSCHLRLGAGLCGPNDLFASRLGCMQARFRQSWASSGL